MNEHDILRRRELVTQLRERFNALRMTAGVLGMEENAKQAAEWLGFIAAAADDCSALVAMLTDAPEPPRRP